MEHMLNKKHIITIIKINMADITCIKYEHKNILPDLYTLYVSLGHILDTRGTVNNKTKAVQTI